MGWIHEQLSMFAAEAINSYFLELLESSIQLMSEFIVGIMSMAHTVLDYPIVVQAIAYAQGIAFTLLAVKVAFDAFHTWILYSNGDSDADPKGLLLGTAKAAAIIGCLPWGVRYLYLFGTTMALEVSQLSGISPEASFGNFLIVFTAVPLLVFVGLISIILIIVIFIQSFVRAATLGMLAVVGPLVAVQQVEGGQLFSMWLKELLVVCFSQAIQIFMLLAAAYSLAGVAMDTPFKSGLMFLAWLWATMKAPGTLKQMLYSSGVGSVAGSAAQTAGTMVIVRKMMTRGV